MPSGCIINYRLYDKRTQPSAKSVSSVKIRDSDNEEISVAGEATSPLRFEKIPEPIEQIGLFHNTEINKNQKNNDDPDDEAERVLEYPYYEKYGEYGGNYQKYWRTNKFRHNTSRL